jgi:hypothetical protein
LKHEFILSTIRNKEEVVEEETVVGRRERIHRIREKLMGVLKDHAFPELYIRYIGFEKKMVSVTAGYVIHDDICVHLNDGRQISWLDIFQIEESKEIESRRFTSLSPQVQQIGW